MVSNAAKALLNPFQGFVEGFCSVIYYDIDKIPQTEGHFWRGPNFTSLGEKEPNLSHQQQVSSNAGSVQQNKGPSGSTDCALLQLPVSP